MKTDLSFDERLEKVLKKYVWPKKIPEAFKTWEYIDKKKWEGLQREIKAEIAAQLPEEKEVECLEGAEDICPSCLVDLRWNQALQEVKQNLGIATGLEER